MLLSDHTVVPHIRCRDALAPPTTSTPTHSHSAQKLHVCSPACVSLCPPALPAYAGQMAGARRPALAGGHRRECWAARPTGLRHRHQHVAQAQVWQRTLRASAPYSLRAQSVCIFSAHACDPGGLVPPGTSGTQKRQDRCSCTVGAASRSCRPQPREQSCTPSWLSHV